MRYCPVPSVITERLFSISAGLVASTTTPGRIAPEASRATPAIDALARGGVRFPAAVAAVPLTLPSHTSLLTGLEPRVTRPGLTRDEILRPGMIFTVEPGAYLPGVGGARIEDDVLVTASGCEVLTSVPIDLEGARAALRRHADLGEGLAGD